MHTSKHIKTRPAAGSLLGILITALLIISAVGITYIKGKTLFAKIQAKHLALTLVHNKLSQLKHNTFSELEILLKKPEKESITLNHVKFNRYVNAIYLNEKDYSQKAAKPTGALKIVITITDNDDKIFFGNLTIETIAIKLD